MRAISTVLDVSLFLVLVSAAVATLAIPAATPPESTADETAEALASSTTNVTYTVAPGATAGTHKQRATGTHADLLGRAAVANLTYDGESLAPHSRQFRQAVRNDTTSVLSWSSGRTGVVAHWRPYPDAPLHGSVSAGASPPPDVEVSTATVTVPASISVIDAEAVVASAPDDDYQALGEAIADAVLNTTLGDRPLGSSASTATAIRGGRITAAADALDISAGRIPGVGEAVTTDAVRQRLAARLATDLRERYDSPHAAASDVRTGTVRIVVREWSP